jgi:hypothetical protein
MLATAIRWVRRVRQTSDRTVGRQGQPRRAKLDPHRDYILGLVEANHQRDARQACRGVMCMRLGATLKALLRKAAEPTVDRLWDVIGHIIESLHAQRMRQLLRRSWIRTGLKTNQVLGHKFLIDFNRKIIL